MLNFATFLSLLSFCDNVALYILNKFDVTFS